MLRSGRDLGASLLPERAGRERAGAGGTSFVGLAWRLQRPTLLGWCIFAALLGGIAGGLGPVVSDVIGGNDSLRELIVRLVPGGRAELIDVFTTALLGIAGVLAAAAGIQAVLRMRAEEAEGRAELLLATPRSRARWLGANLVLAAASVRSSLSSPERRPPSALLSPAWQTARRACWSVPRWRTFRPPSCSSRQRRSLRSRAQVCVPWGGGCWP